MPATARAPRPLSASTLLLALALISRPASADAQQLGSAFPLEDEQTAVVRVTPGQFLRVRLKDGSRAGGPLISATPTAFTVGPSVAFSDHDAVLRLGTVDSMWVRAYSTRRGSVAGGLLGALAGMGIGLTSSSLCPTSGPASTGAKPCARGVITSTASGALFGGLLGSLVGSGRTHWRRLLPRGDTPPPSDLAATTVITGADSGAYDPRAIALMRIPRGTQVRLTFVNRGDLAGYLLRTGAGSATIGVLAGMPTDTPVPMWTIASVWERGTAKRTGATAGLVFGSALGVALGTRSSACDPGKSCRAAIIAEAGTGALFGYLLGGVIGDFFPKWYRRY